MNGAASDVGPWHVDSQFAVRIAGLPVSALAELQFIESFSLLERITSLNEALAGDGAVLSDLLYDVIGALDKDNEFRPGLVGLRRAVHRVRRPTRREWNDSIPRILPVELVGRIRHWLAQLDARDGSRQELTGVLTAETERKTHALRGICDRPVFRRALAQASQSLSGELERWLAAPSERPRRRKLARLAKYVTRAAAKTSPFSTFALSGLGSWSAGSVPVSFPPSPGVHGVLELDGSYLCLVRAAIAGRPELAGGLRVKVNSSARLVGTELEFIGRSPGEPLVTVALTPAIRECLRLTSGDQGSSLAELRDGVLRAAGSDTAAVHRFIGKLTDAGLLDVHIPVPDHAVDPMGELLGWLKANVSTGAAELVDRVADVGARLRERVAVDDLEIHRRRQIALQRAMSDLAAYLRLPPAMATTTRFVFHETGVIAGSAVVCSIDSWQPALSDLAVVRRWLSIFDTELPIRLALGTYFRERFGSGASVPFHVFYRTVQRELADEAARRPSAAASDVRDLLGGSQPWSLRLADRRLARLHALDDLRSEARAVAMSPPDEDGVVRVDPGSIAKVVADWPDWVKTTRSCACYVQPRMVAGSLELVLNLVHGGHGRGRSRLRYLIERAGGDVAAMASSDGPDGSVLAELGGLLGSTVNVRSASAPYEIDYPFSVSARPSGQRLCLADLVVVHETSRDLIDLVSESLGRRITPLHLGMMANFQLPRAARFVDRAFGTAYLAHPVAPPLIPIDSFTLPDNVDHYPRVVIGRVVIQRARWVVAASRIPHLAAGDEDADYLLRLIEWIRVNGLPTRCFVRVGSGGFRGEHPKSRKPVYLDFRNFFSVMDFAQQLDAGEFVLFEEALPDPLDTDRFCARQARVAEFLVELTDGQAGS